ncbi:MAG: TonB-dependent receptor [Bacteroidetes bacterium]|nr:TonB-dependent receptor [Bacteroidota bacterium]
MFRKIIVFSLIIFSLTQLSFSQGKTDAHLFGHVVNGGKHIPFASITLIGTTIGTSTDETGHYRIINVPEGTYIIRASAIGYKPVEKEVTIVAGVTLEIDFNLVDDAIGLDEVVVTGDRNEIRRRESSVIVNVVAPKTLNLTHSLVIGEGLNFTSGLRMENNCQNCGFTQLRMNGLEGPYSQILINSRPIFSGLAGVYGLELIPSNMVERIEVIRGGGSALYGSNAIGGTVNLILKDPVSNSYEIGFNGGLTGVGLADAARYVPDNSMNFSATAVSSDIKTGLAVFGFFRNRQPFDANNDGFSELSSIDNTSVGARAFHRFSSKSKLTADFFNIRESRRGGDMFDYPLHQANIAEAVDHNITTAALTFNRFFRSTDMLSLFASAQHVNRDSYYGAGQSLSDYGHTTDLTYTAGAQYKMQFNDAGLVFGIENQGGQLNDKKLGFPDYDNAIIIDGEIVEVPHTDNVIIANQIISITGAFAQMDYTYKKFKTTAGLRFDNYHISDVDNPGNDISGNVLSPRITLMYDASSHMQSRVSYAKGYRAPQVFDEDLHILTSGSRKIIHRNAPGLKQESSHSFMASLDFNYSFGHTIAGLLIEGFYTKLENPFANEYGEMDEFGVVEYTRINAEDGAVVKGINSELTVIPSEKISFKLGFTIQNSMFEEEQEFDEKRFLRTPNDYGYATAEWKPSKRLSISTSGTYTGKMLVPYFGPEIDNPEDGELRVSRVFLDMGFRVGYDVKVNGAIMQLFGGMKNIFNSYQNDFDSGIDRDPGYMYGPNQPRMIYFGLRLGNRLR